MSWPQKGGPGTPVTIPGQITSAYTVTSTDYFLPINATNAAFTVTLPPAASVPGQTYSLKKMDSSANAVTVKANGSELIDGFNTYGLNAQYSTLNIISIITGWSILSKI